MIGGFHPYHCTFSQAGAVTVRHCSFGSRCWCSRLWPVAVRWSGVTAVSWRTNSTLPRFSSNTVVVARPSTLTTRSGLPSSSTPTTTVARSAGRIVAPGPIRFRHLCETFMSSRPSLLSLLCCRRQTHASRNGWLDGVKQQNIEQPQRKPRLYRDRTPTSAQLTHLADKIANRACRHLARKGWLGLQMPPR